MTTSSTSPVIAVGDADFDAGVLESETPVLVDFWAAWCPPCRVMHPILDELAREREDVRFASLDVEAAQAVTARYGVLSMPTFILFRHGEPILRLVGSRPKARLQREIAEALGA